jgi:hypothetical protein
LLLHADGYLNIVDREFKVNSFQAHVYAVTHVHQMKDRNIVVSIGHDEERASTVKIWNLDKLDKEDRPMQLKSFNVEKYTVPVCYDPIQYTKLHLNILITYNNAGYLPVRA